MFDKHINIAHGGLLFPCKRSENAKFLYAEILDRFSVLLKQTYDVASCSHKPT